MAYYHVSRTSLPEGTIELVPDYYNRLATHGLADEHFEQFWKEIVFEKTRRLQYSQKVSRLSCVFMVDSLEIAKEYKISQVYAQNGVIYEVEPPKDAIINRFDMNLLNCNGFPFNSMLEHSAAYFGEFHTENPFWEHLCGSKVKIIREVD